MEKTMNIKIMAILLTLSFCGINAMHNASQAREIRQLAHNVQALDCEIILYKKWIIAFKKWKDVIQEQRRRIYATALAGRILRAELKNTKAQLDLSKKRLREF